MTEPSTTTKAKEKEKKDVYVSNFDLQIGTGCDKKGISHNDCFRLEPGEEFTADQIPDHAEDSIEDLLAKNYVHKKEAK